MKRTFVLAICTAMSAASQTGAQSFPTEDPVVREIWAEGIERSQTYPLAQALMDSLGPRLTGTPAMEAAQAWVVETYRKWGIEAETEQYGTWMRWARGRTHVDLVEPRVRSLEAMLLAWSPGTGGETVRGEVITFPDVSTPAAFEAWLPSVRGRFVAISFPQPTCRPDDDWRQWATPATLSRMQAERTAAAQAWQRRIQGAGFDPRTPGLERLIARRLESAGAAGVLTSQWSNGWGAQRIFNAGTERAPTVGIGCEDYGLLTRLAENGQQPVVELMAEGSFLGEGPVYNVIGRIPGADLPNEYVMLSAHFDSWDGASGATDNGTGTITMLEAMRILKMTYPRPKRTILVGHWSGEEQGLNGSRAFSEDHPDVVDGLQALFNQDNGTGRIVRMSAQGLTGAAGQLGDWLAKVPQEITSHIQVSFPGSPSGGGSDHASFICHGAPGFSLGSSSWNYGTYTWHTNRDSFDKISFDEIENNATLTAMLVYLASEDPVKISRERRALTGVNRFTGQPQTWPDCEPARREWSERRP